MRGCLYKGIFHDSWGLGNLSTVQLSNLCLPAERTYPILRRLGLHLAQFDCVHSFAVPQNLDPLLSSCRSGTEGTERRSWRQPVRPWKRSCDWRMLGIFGMACHGNVAGYFCSVEPWNNDKAITDAYNGVFAFGWVSVQGGKFINSKQVSDVDASIHFGCLLLHSDP